MLLVVNQAAIQASCLTLSADHKFIYVGFQYFGIVQKYSTADWRKVCAMVVNSGDVVDMFEVWPSVLFASGSDCTVHVVEIGPNCNVDAVTLMRQPQRQAKMSVDSAIYADISEGVSSMCRIMTTLSTMTPSNQPSIGVCQINQLAPRLVQVRNSMSVQKLDPTPNNNVRKHHMNCG